MTTSRYLKEAPFDAERKRRKAAGKPMRMCRWCGKELTGRRTSWCSDKCAQEFSIRTSSNSARWAVEQRDKGVCSECGVDVLELQAIRDRLRGDSRYYMGLPKRYEPFSLFALMDRTEALAPLISHRWRKKRQDAAHVVDWARYTEKRRRWLDAIWRSRSDAGMLRQRAREEWEFLASALVERGWTYSRVNSGMDLWDMDHIVPVSEGGGACGLENLRTLCLPCHKQHTAELAAKRAEARRGPDPQLSLLQD